MRSNIPGAIISFDHHRPEMHNKIFVVDFKRKHIFVAVFIQLFGQLLLILILT